MNTAAAGRILLSGWFSFEDMGVTAGDIMACEVVGNWLSDADQPFDVAWAPSFQKGVVWQEADPDKYTHVIFICGPFGNGWPVTEFLTHFSNSKLIGINLSMLEPVEQWNPFDLLYERDSDRRNLPDLALISRKPAVPVVGVILSHVQKEYGERARQLEVNSMIEEVLSSQEMSVVRIDTNLKNNQYGLRTAGEVESLIAKMDLVITTRLHGMVLALKNDVPVIAIDPIDGGAKISSQAKVLDWPLLLTVRSLSAKNLKDGMDLGLSPEVRLKTRKSREKGHMILMEVYREFIGELKTLHN